LPEQVKTELLSKSQSVSNALSKLDLDALSKSQIEVIPRAVEMTVEHEMFYVDKEFAQAIELLSLAQQRLQAAAQGKCKTQLLEVTMQDTSHKPILLSGGYRSRIDGSSQPYGLVVPAGWKADPSKPVRLDVWLHGRGEKVSEVACCVATRCLHKYTKAKRANKKITIACNGAGGRVGFETNASRAGPMMRNVRQINPKRDGTVKWLKGTVR